MQISVAILDDNKAFLEEFTAQVQKQCETLGLDVTLYPFDQSQAFYTFLNGDTRIDAAFLDILLPEENGISFAAKMQRSFPHIKLLFITAVLENAVDIFDVRPSYFLVKPVTEERLKKALLTVVQELQKEENDTVVLSGKGYLHRIKKNDIYYIESRGRQMEIHMPDSVLSVYGSISEMEKSLDDRFFRCHRSYLVNLTHVLRIDKLDYILPQNCAIPISRNRRAQAREQFFHHLALDERSNDL